MRSPVLNLSSCLRREGRAISFQALLPPLRLSFPLGKQVRAKRLGGWKVAPSSQDSGIPKGRTEMTCGPRGPARLSYQRPSLALGRHHDRDSAHAVES